MKWVDIPLSNIKRMAMTAGPEWKHILLFSLPIMAGNLLQQLYNTVDGIVVGNFVSQNALAATGTAGTLAFIFLAFAMGFGNGSGIMIAQFFGAERYEDMRSAVSTALILLVGMGLVFSVTACVFARPLLHSLMNVAEGEILEYAVDYFSVYAVGIFLQFLYNSVSAILRAVGDSKATLYFLLVSSVLNLVLDVLFVVVFHWGITGAAVATVISQLGSALVSVWYMFKKYPIFRFARGEFSFHRDKCLLCLKLGIPTTIQQSIVSFGHVFIQRLVNSFGEAAMAAFSVGGRIESYMFVPTIGLNTAMANFSAQNVGAGKFDRVRRGCRATLAMAFGAAVTIQILLYIFARPVSGFFGVGGEALELSVSYLRFMCLVFWFFSLYMVFAGLLQGAGDVIVTTACSLIALTVRVTTAYILAPLLPVGVSAAWLTMPIGWLFAFSISFWRYLSGKWKEKGIVKHG